MKLEFLAAVMAEVRVVENRTVVGNDVTWWIADDGGMHLDASEGGLWSGAFVPPPPRPLFLDETAVPDGLTTCDLCSWAWQGQKRPFHHVDSSTESPGELGWMLTLIIVSIISAAIGAVVMITALHCKSRIKKSTSTDSSGVQSSVGNKDSSSPGVSVENHYTHMTCEALYAELERGSAYQNSAYADGDASAPSSAYYSDLSGPERAYEEVGLNAWPPPPLPATRDAGIAVSTSQKVVSSDYV